MHDRAPPARAALVSIDGQSINADCKVLFDERALLFCLPDRQQISIYSFNTQMLDWRPDRQRKIEKFAFHGPRLGIYHATAEVREGPYVNHRLDQLVILVEYSDADGTKIIVAGSADLADSSFDVYWYKGPVTGVWSFRAEFNYKHSSQ